MKPRVFIASSVEGLEVAYALQENLEHDCEPTVWSQGVFDMGQQPLTSLVKQARASDAAIFVFSPDDTSLVRSASKQTVRENVLFELGLFIGTLGPEKCFVVRPDNFPEMHLPSDLIGYTTASYKTDRQDKKVLAAIGPACNKIRRQLREAELLTREATAPAAASAVETALLTHRYRLYFNPQQQRWKAMRFGEGGQILEGNNGNEHLWRIARGKLELVQLDGAVHSRFTFDPKAKRFGHTNDPDTLSIRDQFMIVDEPPRSPSGTVPLRNRA
jgi:hypothetical protein